MRPTNRAHRLVNTAAAWIRLNLNDKAGFRAKNLRSRADIPSSRLSDPTNLKNEEISFYICGDANTIPIANVFEFIRE